MCSFFIVLVIDDYTVYFIINLLFKTRFANGLQIFVKIQDLHSNEIHLSLAFIRAEKNFGSLIFIKSTFNNGLSFILID